ncbi:MAG: hypothetical protein R2711_12150 [Acidimicrobiales bacterium]
MARLRGRLAGAVAGATEDEIEAGWASLTARGLAADREVIEEGIALRQQIEDDTDRRTTRPWELPARPARTGSPKRSSPARALLERAPTSPPANYQPASRSR